jgi:hypothetical protein
MKSKLFSMEKWSRITLSATTTKESFLISFKACAREGGYCHCHSTRETTLNPFWSVCLLWSLRKRAECQ